MTAEGAAVDTQGTAIDARVLDEIIDGLSRAQKELPPKYFYDARGSQLFVEITEQPEYYPTDCEIDLLKHHAGDMSQRIGPGAALLELGSGSSMKTPLLLRPLEDPAGYVPVDISRSALEGAVADLSERFPDLRIEPVCADYTRSFELPKLGEGVRWAVFYPGSTVGNMRPSVARSFLARLRTLLSPGDGFLVGVDLKKSPEILDAAYNDAAGVTAEFNRNMLVHLNRRVGSNFDPDRFEHRAFYNPDEGRVELHLMSTVDQLVRVGDRDFELTRGESIHTENSYKYSVEDFRQLAEGAGLEPEEVWLDPRGWFSMHWMTVPQ
jgi:dimethylhistidine N-methyltransferase